VQGVQARLQKFYLLKMRAKSMEIWANTLKIRAKFAPNILRFEKYGTQLALIRKKWRHTCFDLIKKWRPKSHEDLLEVIRNTVFMKTFKQKSAQNFFGQVWGNSGKILRTPKNLPAPTPMPVFDTSMWAKVNCIASGLRGVN